MTKTPALTERLSYRKKPVEIEAFQWTKHGMTLAPEWLVARETVYGPRVDGKCWREDEDLLIATLEGTMRANPGDWVIKGVKGEIYPCKPDIFAMTYEPTLSLEGGSTTGEDHVASVGNMVWSGQDKHHFGQLKIIADKLKFTATRVGQPGCAARLAAGDDEVAIRWAIDALSTPPAKAIEEGSRAEDWVLVPREPTEAMLSKGHREIDWHRDGQSTFPNEHPSQTDAGGTSCKQDLIDAWKAMLAALQPHTVQSEGEG